MKRKVFQVLAGWVFLLVLAGQAVASFGGGSPTGGVVPGTPNKPVLADAGGAGSLTVTILPSEVVTAGAKWHRGGSHFPGFPWYASGATEAGVPTGDWPVAFSDVAGWNSPDTQWVTINDGQTATATGTYTRQTGSLTVTILPQEAVAAGAKWRRAGTSTWNDSGATEAGIFTGPQAVEFNDVPWWNKPGFQPVTVSNGQTATAAGTYTRQTGSLIVAILPPEAMTAGAKWRRTGTNTWKDSWATETGVLAGPQTVEFNEVTGWIKPVNQTVTVMNGQAAGVNGTYIRLTGSLTVAINPPGVVTAGAKWRRLGTTTWRDSGSTETGVPTGLQTVEFNDVTKWNTPANQTVTISANQTMTLIMNFIRRALPFPFFDDFSADKGWFDFQAGGWERGTAQAGPVEKGNPGPGRDHTGAGDNTILGYAIGSEGYPNDLYPTDIISPPIDCTGQERVILKFWRLLNAGAGDHASVSVSVDEKTWHPVWQGTANDSQWTSVAYDLSEYAANEARVFVRFTMGPTDSTDRYSGWNIDDLEVSSSPVFPAEGTTGTEFSIVGSGFGEKKGKALIINASEKASLTVVDWNDRLIRCQLSTATAPGIYDMTIAPIGSSPIVEETIEVRSPEIADIRQETDESGEPVLAIEGIFFGTKKGKVYLSYVLLSGNQKKTACGVTIWTNEYIECRIPESMDPGIYDLILTNGVAAVMEPASVTLP